MRLDLTTAVRLGWQPERIKRPVELPCQAGCTGWIGPKTNERRQNMKTPFLEWKKSQHEYGEYEWRADSPVPSKDGRKLTYRVYANGMGWKVARLTTGIVGCLSYEFPLEAAMWLASLDVMHDVILEHFRQDQYETLDEWSKAISQLMEQRKETR